MEEELPRETGAERSGTNCPACGEELPAVTTAYGSVVPGACQSCPGPEGVSQLEQQRAAASVESPDEDEADDELDDEEEVED